MEVLELEINELDEVIDDLRKQVCYWGGFMYSES
jgi:hypothetical protein